MLTVTRIACPGCPLASIFLNRSPGAMRILLSTMTVLSLLVTVEAQTASMTPYGLVCPTGTAALAVTGTPKLGGSFTVTGMKSPLACTRRFCQNCTDFCNSCTPGSILAVGLTRISVPFPPSGCKLLTDALLALIPWSAATSGSIKFNVPNNAALLGQKFTMQRADISYRGTNFGCNPWRMATGFIGLSNGVEGLIGK
jgi:hypothetical protein